MLPDVLHCVVLGCWAGWRLDPPAASRDRLEECVAGLRTWLNRAENLWPTGG